MKRLIIIQALLVSSILLHSQTVSVPSNDPAYYTYNLFLGGYISISNVTSNCVFGSPASMGEFSGFDSCIGMDYGIIISTGEVFLAPVSNTSGSSGATTGTGSDSLLAALVPGYTINDAAILEFDYVPYTNIMTFSYIFASEEYPEWVGSSYNDVFGFFVTGPNPMGGNYSNSNVALIPGTTLPVTIDNINTGSFSQYYVDNTGSYCFTYDGYTTVLDVIVPVTPNETYHIKIGIGDAGDSAYDSAVLLNGNSFSSAPLTFTYTPTVPSGTKSTATAVEDSCGVRVTVTLPDTARADISYCYNIGGSAINGTDYDLLSGILTIPADSISTDILINPVNDGITEAPETVELVLCNVNDTILVTITDKDISSGMSTSGESKFSVFPNPASEEVNIFAEGLEKVVIKDLTGRMAVEYPSNGDQLTIDLKHFERATYMITISCRTGFYTQKLFVH